MIRIFLDSGAYSAWAKGKPVVLQEYIDFIHEVGPDTFEVYANLDDIENPEQTWKNQREMERQGLKPLPVYHVGEPIKFLRMAMEYDYFAVGGMALQSESIRISRFDFIFKELCPASNNFLPTHKVHGFGMTSPKLMTRYPWYSVDSTSWVQYGLYGTILIPMQKQGKYDYTRSAYKVFISNRSPARRTEGKHYDTLSTTERQYVLDYIKWKRFCVGFSKFKTVSEGYELAENERFIDKKNGKVEIVIERGLCNDNALRDEFNLLWFNDMARSLPKWPWAFKPKKMGFFNAG